jgi:uncharacterized protein (TIGR02001 family)
MVGMDSAFMTLNQAGLFLNITEGCLIMKKTILATAVLAIFASSFAMAEEKKPDNELSFNIGATTDYRYRGISQSGLDPALQGGADFVNNPTGLYAGTWLSTIKWVKDSGGGNKNVEVDLYAGKKGDIGGGFSYDVGGLYYWYPDNNLSTNANTFELYGKVGYGPAYVKYSNALTNTFGVPDSKNSGYLDVGADSCQAEVNADKFLGYADLVIGIAEIGIVLEHLMARVQVQCIAAAEIDVGTDADKTLYRTPSGSFTGKTALVLTATKTF